MYDLVRFLAKIRGSTLSLQKYGTTGFNLSLSDFPEFISAIFITAAVVFSDDLRRKSGDLQILRSIVFSIVFSYLLEIGAAGQGEKDSPSFEEIPASFEGFRQASNSPIHFFLSRHLRSMKDRGRRPGRERFRRASNKFRQAAKIPASLLHHPSVAAQEERIFAKVFLK